MYAVINVWKNIHEFSTGFYTSVEKVWMNSVIYCIVTKCCELLWSWPPLYHKSSQMSSTPRQSIFWHKYKVFHRQWVIISENTVHHYSYTNGQWICLWKTITKLWKTCGKSITNLWKTVYNQCENVWVSVYKALDRCCEVCYSELTDIGVFVLLWWG